MFEQKLRTLSGWPDWAKFCHFGYFLKPRCFGENMVCCRFLSVFTYKGFHVDVLDFQIELRWHFFGNLFGYFFQIWANFFSIPPVTLNAVFVDCHGLKFARKKISFKGMCCKAINCWNFRTCNLRLVFLCCKAINCWNLKTCNLRLVFLIIKGACC